MNSISINVNGVDVDTKMFAPFDVDISRHLRVGENKIKLKIRNNLRNLLGPHHHNLGDEAPISPAAFMRESNVFCHPDGKGESYHGKTAHFFEDIKLVYFGLV
jgi:hypothetical protein